MEASEAKEKKCPFIVEIRVNSKDYVVGTDNINCICSSCMAWIETKEYEYEFSNTHTNTASALEDKGFRYHRSFGDSDEWRKEVNTDNKKGYCQRIGDIS